MGLDSVWASQVVQWWRICLPMKRQEMRIWSLGQEDPLEKEVATDFSILAWEITWTEEPGGLQSMAHRIRHDWVTEQTHTQSTQSRYVLSREQWSCWATFQIINSESKMLEIHRVSSYINAKRNHTLQSYVEVIIIIHFFSIYFY